MEFTAYKTKDGRILPATPTLEKFAKKMGLEGVNEEAKAERPQRRAPKAESK